MYDCIRFKKFENRKFFVEKNRKKRKKPNKKHKISCVFVAFCFQHSEDQSHSFTYKRKSIFFWLGTAECPIVIECHFYPLNAYYFILIHYLFLQHT